MRLLGEFAEWLIKAATRDKSLAELHRLFCEKLVELGLPLWRSSLGLEVLDPEIDGPQIRWIAHEVSTRLMPRGTDYTGSPGYVVDKTGKPYRRRLDKATDDLPFLEDLREMGATDYYITPLHFLDVQRTAHISFATLRPEGFTEGEITLLEEAALIFGPCAERYVLRKIAIDLLTTYVGRRSAVRIYDGAVERGKPEMITATILIADLRGFTHYSETQPMANVLTTLNDFFDALVEAIEPKGGEVLKFIGDALLAIFPANESESLPYAATLAAALDARRRISELNERRKRDELPPLKFGLALGAGEIAYGNIGSRKRLDFTAIGPAVNATSRLLEIAKKCDHDIVISEAFAHGSGSAFLSLGRHELRDIAVAQEVFSVAQET
jgi:adenylate cyclase